MTNTGQRARENNDFALYFGTYLDFLDDMTTRKPVWFQFAPLCARSTLNYSAMDLELYLRQLLDQSIRHQSYGNFTSQKKVCVDRGGQTPLELNWFRWWDNMPVYKNRLCYVISIISTHHIHLSLKDITIYNSDQSPAIYTPTLSSTDPHSGLFKIYGKHRILNIMGTNCRVQCSTTW